ncbi:hypothetical protein COB57_02050 [Candidatus Peregrinibacteria bacterium]|nr:MAG: hypothetical protein COB57_02050 [Candidatus Peregrinibacteria bacterium]
MIFQNPFFFWLILIPLLFLFIRKNRKQVPLHPAIAYIHAQLTFWQKYSLLIIKVIFSSLIIGGFIFLLMRPQIEIQKQKIEKKGIDIVIAIDVSYSMLAEDITPNRMQAAKKHISNFVSKLQNDRAAIVVFAGKAFTQSPLTFDYGMIQTFLAEISPFSIQQNAPNLAGTSIGDAILSATNRLNKDRDRSRVIILITDGDANIGIHPEKASEIAKNENIKIYTIGVGKENGAKIPFTNRLGQKQYIKNSDGTFAVAKFDETRLKKLSAITGGKYFRATDNQSFQNIFQHIQKLEKTNIEIENFIEKKDSYKSYLIPFFLFFTVYLFYFMAINPKTE